jgi:Spy/CpxP family protein refolding chaperone
LAPHFYGVYEGITHIYAFLKPRLHASRKFEIGEVIEPMKRQIARLAAVGSIAAGMIFAQAQTAQPAPQGQTHNAQPSHAKRNHRFQPRQRMMAALNLTPEQKTMAKSIFGQAREASKPARMELRQNREAMTAAVKSGNKAQIERLSGERGQLMAKMSANRGEAMAKFYQALTPAQRAKADQMQARFQARTRQFRAAHKGTNG